MAWSPEELDFFSRALGQTITPEMAAGTLGNNVYMGSDGRLYRNNPLGFKEAWRFEPNTLATVLKGNK